MGTIQTQSFLNFLQVFSSRMIKLYVDYYQHSFTVPAEGLYARLVGIVYWPSVGVTLLRLHGS